MTSGTLETILDYIQHICSETQDETLNITFHGGEPLVCGYDFWHSALYGIFTRFPHRQRNLSIQSNLWLLNAELCELFREYNVFIGTSLDGPQDITDSARGEGYFEQTMRGIRLAQRYGIHTGCIATINAFNRHQWQEIVDFFRYQRMSVAIHAAVLPYGQSRADFVLSPKQYADILGEMLSYYLKYRREIGIVSLDHMCQGVYRGEGTICLFRDCFGKFLAFAPSGDMYFCQRLCGHAEYRIGNVHDMPSLSALYHSDAAQNMQTRLVNIAEACGECRHFDYCKGGCVYNVLAAGATMHHDPYCEAYQTAFDYIRAHLLDDMTSPQNILAIAEMPAYQAEHPYLRRGPMIELARSTPHPSEIATTCKRIIAAVELTKGIDIPEVAARLVKQGICRTQTSGEASLKRLQHQLLSGYSRVNNLFLHITNHCQLECTHCYAEASPYPAHPIEMPLNQIRELLVEAESLKVSTFVLTGGEPLMHHDQQQLLTFLNEVRPQIRDMRLFLSTNLAYPLNDTFIALMCHAFSTIGVSIDGGDQSHDKWRGRGRYHQTLENIKILHDYIRKTGVSCTVSLEFTPIPNEPNEHSFEYIHKITKLLGLHAPQILPMLPLGRASKIPCSPVSKGLSTYLPAMDIIKKGFHPTNRCLGSSLHIDPNGDCYPCYACHWPEARLGNIAEKGLHGIIESRAYKELLHYGVDTSPTCKICEVRYLCGGACLVWTKNQPKPYDSPSPDCSGIKELAHHLIETAFNYLNSY